MEGTFDAELGLELIVGRGFVGNDCCVVAVGLVFNFVACFCLLKASAILRSKPDCCNFLTSMGRMVRIRRLPSPIGLVAFVMGLEVSLMAVSPAASPVLFGGMEEFPLTSLEVDDFVGSGVGGAESAVALGTMPSLGGCEELILRFVFFPTLINL